MSTFCSKWSGFYPYEMQKFVTAFCFVWNCSESPFLEVCKLTDLMAVKVGRFTDLRAILFEYCRIKSSKILNMQSLTHVLGKLKWLILAFKVGEFTDLMAVFESHCCLFARMRTLQRKDYGIFAEGMEFFLSTYWFFALVWQPQLDGTNEFSHRYGSRMIKVKIFMIGLIEFWNNCLFHSFTVFFSVGRTGKMSQLSLSYPCTIS